MAVESSQDVKLDDSHPEHALRKNSLEAGHQTLEPHPGASLRFPSEKEKLGALSDAVDSFFHRKRPLSF